MLEKISINTQSSIKISTNKIIYFDPFQIEESLHDADYIFITHSHYDHYDIPSIKNIMKEDTTIIFPESMEREIIGVFPSQNLIGIKPNEIYEINGLPVKTIRSYNINKDFHPKENNWVGYLVTIEDKIIYVAGDTDITDDNQHITCDIALIPIGGKYTMNYEEAAKLINTIKPNVVIPTHYGSIIGTKEDAKNFFELLDKDIIYLELIK